MTDDKLPARTGARTYYLEATPGAGGRYAYSKSGLSCRKLGTGRWQVRRADGRPLDQVTIQVSVKEPWASEVGSCIFASCATHGDDCPPDGADCRSVNRVGSASRWITLVKAEATPLYLFEVHLMQIPKLPRDPGRQEEHLEAREWIAANIRLADGAGFVVVLASGS
jgi:hypothetical protein